MNRIDAPLYWFAHYVVRGLCALHPARFRREHAPEIQQVFAERFAEESTSGSWPLCKFLLSTWTDLALGIFLTRTRNHHLHSSDSFSIRKGDAMLSQFLQDIRFALRNFSKSPGFAILAILTLALGIGATTSIFSVLYGVVLRPLPYPEPERLVAINQSSRETPVMSVSYPNFQDWQVQSRSFESMGAVTRWSITLTGEGEAERLFSARASAGLFSVLKTQPILGRLMTPDEDRPGSAAVALLSEGLWKRRFARDPQVLGKSLILNGEPHTVVGVMPANYYLPTIDVFVSIGRWGLRSRSEYPGIRVLARLKTGVTLTQAQADMSRVARNLAAQYEEDRNQTAVVFPLQEQTVQDVRSPLWVLLGAVGFVLLIGCANVANLLLARAAGRQKEIAVRRALGAGRGRLVRQLMTEGLLLSFTAGALGIVLAFWVTDLIVGLGPNLPRLAEIQVDARVLAFAFALTLLTNFFFGLAPAWLASRVDLAQSMRDGSRSTSRGHTMLRHGLLIGEVAFALILLIGAGLTLQSFQRVAQANNGVNPENLLTASISLSTARYNQQEMRRQFFDSVIEKLEALPGVTSVAAVQPLPLAGDTWFRSFVIEGRPFPELGMAQTADNFHVTPDYFKTMGVPLLRGRYFTAADRAGAEEVCIVDEQFAEKYFPGQDPVGQRLAWGFNWTAASPPQRWARIVGVVGHVKQRGADRESRLQIYNAFAQATLGMAAFVMKTQGDPAALAPQLRQVVRELDSNLALYEVQPLAQHAERLRSERRVTTTLLNAFAVVALVLACIGIYGVMAYSVAQRTPEIGIRMALGAKPGDVYGLVLGNGLRHIAAGLAVGIAAALGMSRALQGMLFGIGGQDPVTYLAVLVVLSIVATAACYLPARRATRVNPIIALRNE